MIMITQEQWDRAMRAEAAVARVRELVYQKCPLDDCGCANLPIRVITSGAAKLAQAVLRALDGAE